MNLSNFRISLDIHDMSSQVSISVKRGDTCRRICAVLTENGKPYNIADGCYAFFRAKKPADSTGKRAIVYNDCTIENNTIYYTLTAENTEIAGIADCEFSLYDGNKQLITSPHFTVVIDNTVNTDNEVETVGHNEVTTLTALISEATELCKDADAAKASADNAKNSEDAAKASEEKAEEYADSASDYANRSFEYAENSLSSANEAKQYAERAESVDTKWRTDVANAITATKSGAFIRVDDVSPIEHPVSVKVNHDNPITVTVTKCGKNLIAPFTGTADLSITGVTATISKDKPYVVLNGTATSTYGRLAFQNYQEPVLLKKGVTYFLSAKAIEGSNSSFQVFATSVSDNSKYFSLAGANNPYTPNEDDYFFVGVQVVSGQTYENQKIVIQLEMGKTASEYEEYKGATYTPNADGTVDIVSVHPTMTLFTDTEDVTIECEYNQDANKVLSSLELSGGASMTKDGTIVSQNADFAEVAEWGDGNPNNEDRTGYFVCADVPVDGIVMKKATSVDDVKGVTILAPAFAGNYTEDKVDSEGNLLPKYSYVAIIGFVPVIDNGTCTVGGRCMPDDNGCAIPSSNSMGYQVVNRIDENRVLIIIEPNGDMVQRVKTKIVQLQESVDELSPKKVVFEDGATITVENNTCYCAEAPISTLNVIYPQTDFICSFLFTIADEGNVTISLPQSKYIGGTPSFANGETWEVNIKDGVVVGGLVE